MSFVLENKSCFDFLSTVESGTVDLILIDPPYNISKKTGFQSVKNGVKRFGISTDFGSWDWGFEGLDKVIEQSYRVLKKSGTLIVFYDLWKISELASLMKESGFKQLRFLEWLKTNPVPINSKVNYLTNSREIAVLSVKGGNQTFNSSYDNGVYEYPICNEAGRFHPTQKPLELIKALVRKHSKEGDLVLDCFSGSGTTAVSALSENRSFIGCELSKEYFEKSMNRIELFLEKQNGKQKD